MHTDFTRRFPLIPVLLLSILLLGSGRTAAEPAMWLLQDEDTQIHIFGSVHVLKPNSNWLSPKLRATIEAADQIVLELSPAQQTPAVMTPLVLSHGLLPSGQTLESKLPKAEYDRLTERLSALGLSESYVQSFQPWLAAVTYASIKFMQQGYTAELGVESTIINLAKSTNIPVVGLETAAFQIGLFSSLTSEQQQVLLTQLLDDSDTLETQMETMTRAWLSGDLERLAVELIDSLNGLEEPLLYARNRSWANTLTDALEQPGKQFVAVGAGHLIGEHSLIAELQNLGLSITRVD